MPSERKAKPHVQGVTLPMPDTSKPVQQPPPPTARAPPRPPSVELDEDGREAYQTLTARLDERIAAGTWRPDDHTAWAAATGRVHPEWMSYLAVRFDEALNDGKLTIIDE